MNARHVLPLLALAAGTVQAQAPALSGLSPTPTPPAATSEPPTPVPTPLPKLKRVAGPAAQTGGRGQSLADVVRASQEARKGQPPKKSLGTITNESVTKGGAAGASKTPTAASKVIPQARGAGRPPKTGSDAASAGATPYPTYAVPRDDKGRSEDDWRALVNQTKAQVVDAERRVKELDLKSKQLENDFYAQSDGFHRDGVIKPAWDRARDDLAKARTDLDAARKSLEDLEEEARRSATPPGWLR